MISICIDGLKKPICYKASEGIRQNDIECFTDDYEDFKMILDAVHYAYTQATSNQF